MRIREAAEENRIYHAEDGGRYPDAEAKGRDDRGSEQGIASKTPQCIAQILKHRPHPPSRTLLVALFASALEAAKFDQRPSACLFGCDPVRDAAWTDSSMWNSVLRPVRRRASATGESVSESETR